MREQRLTRQIGQTGRPARTRPALPLLTHTRPGLQIVFPAATTLFADIDSPITLAFLDRAATQDTAAWLSPKRLATWLKPVLHRWFAPGGILHARLEAHPAAPPDRTASPAAATAALVAVLRTLNAQIRILATSIGAHHPPSLRLARPPAAGGGAGLPVGGSSRCFLAQPTHRRVTPVRPSHGLGLAGHRGHTMHGIRRPLPGQSRATGMRRGSCPARETNAARPSGGRSRPTRSWTALLPSRHRGVRPPPGREPSGCGSLCASIVAA
jgi:hypothetical protein